jgi:hypothetical protein
MNTPTQAGRSTPSVTKPLNQRARIAISALLALHLMAVVAAPMAIEPQSDLAGNVWGFFQPYLEAAYLNHGYHFFGPDPGPSHLVRYVVERPDGTTLEGVFPNKEANRPRLLYHRHFMLTERLASGPGNELWMNAFARSYAQHLYALHDAKSVTLYLRRHVIPYRDQVQAGMKLDDPRFYEERELLSYAGESK